MNRRWLWVLIGVVVFFLVLFSGAVAGAGLTYLTLRAFPVRAALNNVIKPVESGAAITISEQPAFLITRVVPGSPADDAGLQVGTMIVAVNGDEFQPEDELTEIIQSFQPGDEITVNLFQPGIGDPRQITVTLGANPDQEDLAYLGIEYSRLPGFGGFRREGDQLFQFDIPKSEGNQIPLPNLPPDFMPFGHQFPQLPESIEQAVVIRSVTPESPAAEAGLEPGDLVTEINGEPITDLDSFVDTIRSFKPGDQVSLTIYRDGESEPMEVEVTLAEDPAVTGQAYIGVGIGGFFRYQYGVPGQNSDNPFHFEFRFPWQDGNQPRDSIGPSLGEEA
jgi:membrane-associated protease RseP (regulator of RpoE activity)